MAAAAAQKASRLNHIDSLLAEVARARGASSYDDLSGELRAFPCRALAVRAVCARLRAIMPLASWRRARWFSSFFDQRMRIARLRLSHE